jgi:hypothetical protein
VGIIIQGFADFAFSESFDDFWRFVFSLLPFSLLAKGIFSISAFSDNEVEDGEEISKKMNQFFP